VFDLIFTFSRTRALPKWMGNSLFHLGEVVRLLDGSCQGADSRNKLKAFRIESFPQFFKQQGEIFLKAKRILRAPHTGKTKIKSKNLFIGSCRIEPVDLEALEAVLFQEGNRVPGQISPSRCIGCNLGKKFRTELICIISSLSPPRNESLRRPSRPGRALA
jgi:hypothetical protein